MDQTTDLLERGDSFENQGNYFKASKVLKKILKKKKFELLIILLWLAFCLPGNIVTGYLYSISSLPKKEDNETEICLTVQPTNKTTEKVTKGYSPPITF